MEAREFVRYAKSYAADDSVKMVLRELKSPRTFPKTESKDPIQRGISDWLEQKQLSKKNQSEWFASLSEEGQTNIRQLLQECSELTLFQFFALIDGIGGEYEGVFEIIAIDEINRTLVNPQNTQMLHSLLSEVCEEDRTT